MQVDRAPEHFPGDEVTLASGSEVFPMPPALVRRRYLVGRTGVDVTYRIEGYLAQHNLWRAVVLERVSFDLFPPA